MDTNKICVIGVRLLVCYINVKITLQVFITVFFLCAGDVFEI